MTSAATAAPAPSVEALRDPRVGAFLAGLDNTGSRAWLDFADGLREGTADERSAASRVYRALCDRLDPRDARDAARALFVFDHVRRLAPDLEPLAERIAGAAPEGTLRALGVLVTARYREAAGDHAGARARLVQVLRFARDSDPALECRAWTNLAQCAALREEPLAGLVAARRALELGAPDGEPRSRAMLHVTRARCFAHLGDAVRAEEETRAAESLAARLPADAARRAANAVAEVRADAHGVRGDGAASLRELDAIVLSPEESVDPAEGGGHAARRARALLLEGRAVSAATEVARARSLGLRSGVAGLGLEVLAARVLAESGAPVAAAQAARRALRAIERPRGSALGAGSRARLARDLAAFFEVDLQDAACARRACDAAASALLEAVLRSERAEAEVAALAEPHPDDVAAVRDHRLRLDRERSLVASALRRLLADAARVHGVAVLRELAVEDGFAAACAWCGRVRGTAGRWTAPPTSLAADEHVALTHGVCPECAARVEPAIGAPAA